MKNFWKSVVTFTKDAAKLVTTFAALGLMLACYMLLGVAMAAAYAFLSHGDMQNYGLFALLAPAGVFLLWIMAKQSFSLHNTRIRTYLWIALAIIVAYSCLPIFFNGVSLGLKAYGWETAASIVFALRFWSLLLVPSFAFIAMVAYENLPAMPRFRWTRKPPSSPPPSEKDSAPRPHGNDDAPHLLRLALTS